jgi:broad specificity phosphatase PhoE
MLGWIGWVLAFYCTWQVGNRRRWAWLANIGAEVLLVAHGLVIQDYSLVAAATLWAVLCIRNWRRWSDNHAVVTL